MIRNINNRLSKKNILIFFCCLSFLASCAYKDRVQPIALPSLLNIEGLYISATSYEDIKQAKEVFGFDIRKAGLLPIGLSFRNEGDKTVKLIPEQTFMIDKKNQAWPVNSFERTYERLEKHTDLGETLSGAGKPALLLGAVGAVTGLAVAIVTGEDIGTAVGKGAAIGAAAGVIGGGIDGYMNTKNKIQNDLENKRLENKEILPNQIGYGMLFFPGYAGEAESASNLKLTLSFSGEIRTFDVEVTKR